MPRTTAPAPLSGALVWWRAAATAFVAFGVGTVAHWSAGGLTPGAVGLGLLFVSLVVPAAALLHRQASGLRLAIMVAIGQLWTHFWLTAAAGHHGDGVAHHAGGLHHAGAMPTFAALPEIEGRRTGSLLDLHQRMVDQQITPADAMPDPFADAVGHLLADLTGPHALMMLAHVVAGALIGWWLACGEQALFGLLGLAVTRWRTAALRLLLDAAALRRCIGVLLRRPQGVAAAPPVRPTPSCLLLTPAPRRGPPLGVLA